ncbi:MBL fold metallo-hydrolase [Tsukamurella sp. 8F]|uniref:MBL fold metallo-hydrolase n=1 Tax=unclassified Tsukamurella TaxID=2633480 RepID=UPI0023B96F84|nr:MULTISPECIES: MBL fold metallo-hydrolase [unclassified Tsukamurella]MDF0529790.1 MBL fold metallo-hydrolase [Tsukamurella sp. 8J]MDF0586982.1 MBL fold metallo-hydrolase [Tsukamurella sp. 8F]
MSTQMCGHRVPVRTAAAGLAVGAAAGAAGLSVARASRGLKRSMGAKAVREFTNTDPDTPHERFGVGKVLRGFVARSRRGRPHRPIPLAASIAPVEASELAVTWYGHSSVLIEVDGYRVLADPVWGERVSPSPTIGPSRLHPVPVALEAIPRVDAVVISHDHYDHLDLPTIEALTRDQDMPFLVPIGVGEHLRSWGVPDDRIVERDWDQAHRIGDLEIVCTEARHFSGRGLSRNSTQWASWSIVGPRHSVFFGGDTGFTERFKLVGDAFGPFDLTLVPIGAYDELWPDVHTTPEQAVEIHRMIAKPDAALVPIHWATFNLAFHDWAEPVERLLAAADEAGIETFVPKPGGRVDIVRQPRGGIRRDKWWITVA